MGGLPSMFAEYNTMDAEGNPIDLSKRIDRYWKMNEQGDTLWSTAKKVLTNEEVAKYTIEAVMGGDDNWQPEQLFAPSDEPIGYAVYKDNRLVDVVRRVSAKYQKDVYQVKAINKFGCFHEQTDGEY